MRRFFVVAALLLAVLGLSVVSPQACAAKLKVGIAYGSGGTEMPFNRLIYEGAIRAEREFADDVELVILEPTLKSSYENLLHNLVRLNCDLVIGGGGYFSEAAEKLAVENPRVLFAVVDGRVRGASPDGNLLCLTFRDQESSYLVGMAAALTSRTGKIGFIGAMPETEILRFYAGYVAGAKAVRPGVQVFTSYVGDKPIAFKNAYRAKELAQQQIAGGADVIFPAAGFAGIGAIEAAAARNVYAIGCDVDQSLAQRAVFRPHILTSTLKRVDTAVYETIRQAIAGNFHGGYLDFGLKEGGVDYARNIYNKPMLDPLQKALEAAKSAIVSGKIQVPSAMEKKERGV